MTELRLRATEPTDLDYVLAAEGDPQARQWVTPWPRERHAAVLTDPDYRHLVLERDGRLVGWSLLAGVTDTNRCVELKRIIVSARGEGVGTRAMRLLVDLAFDELGAHRLWLDVKHDNHRARDLYRRLGFVEEGVMRDAFRTESGEYADLVLMSMLETERPDG